jgi:hypothetical protein
MVAATSPIIPIPFPYFRVGAEELAVRFRIGLDGDRFRWKSGTKPCLYGLHRLSEAQKEGGIGRRGIELPYPLVPRDSRARYPGARIAMLDT